MMSECYTSHNLSNLGESVPRRALYKVDRGLLRSPGDNSFSIVSVWRRGNWRNYDFATCCRYRKRIQLGRWNVRASLEKDNSMPSCLTSANEEIPYLAQNIGSGRVWICGKLGFSHKGWGFTIDWDIKSVAEQPPIPSMWPRQTTSYAFGPL